jgi:hypothetical protein
MSPAGVRTIPLAIAWLTLCGCTSHKWTREIVDGATADVGQWAAMAYHASGAGKRITIVYENTEYKTLKVATRSGSGSSWNPFDVSTLITGVRGRVPAITKDPDGNVYVGYMRGGLPSDSGGCLFVAYSAGPNDAPSAWTHEMVTCTVRLAEPAAIAYLPRGSEPDELHLVYSVSPNHDLWHSYRRVDETTWTRRRFGGTAADPDAGVQGRHPTLVVAGSGPTLWALCAEEGSIVARSFGHAGGAWLTDPIATGMNASVDRRFTAKVIDVPALPAFGRIGIVRANSSHVKYAQSHEAGPFYGFSVVSPTIPTDPNRAFSDPSFAFDGLGLLHISYYDEDAKAAAAYRHNPAIPDVWDVEFIDSGTGDVGRYSSMVYDSVGEKILVIYYDATNGDLKFAQRNAN